jgi:excisionase family DNA binding protein
MRQWAAQSQALAAEWGLTVELTDGLTTLFVAFLRMHAPLGVFSFGPLSISLSVVEDLARRQQWGSEGDYRAFTDLLQQELKRSDRPLDQVTALLALMRVGRGLPGRVFGELGVSPATVEEFARTGRLASSPGERLERLYTLEEAAAYLNVHVVTVRNWIRNGLLPASRLAGQRAIRIKASDLARVLEPIEPADAGE